MDYEALDSLQQTLLQIYERDDDLTFRRVKQRILCIRDKAVVLQFLKQYFPEKERIREVADTIEEIIQYLFSPQNLSDRGSVDPTVRLSDQLGELAEDLDSIVEDVVDYIRQQSDPPPALRSSSSSDPPVVAAELIVINSNGLRRLAEKLKSTDRELPDEDPSDSAPIFPLTSNDVVAGFDDDLSDSASITSSSRSAPTSKDLEVDSNEDLVVGFDENHLVGSNDDVVQIIERVTSRSSSLQILPIVAVGGIGESAFAKYIYDHPTIMGHFDMRAWITITQDYSTESILSKSLASVKGKDHLGRDFLTEFEVGAYDLDVTGTIFFWGRYLIVMDGMWSVEVWDKAQRLFVKHYDGSTIILVTRQMDVAAYFARRGGNLMMPFLDDGQSWLATNKDLVVGFHEDMQQLMDRLIRDSKLHIQTIPIVGMGGIGKSTLAKTVYDNPWIKQHFDIRAWVTISQDYTIASILSQLLASLKGEVDRVGRKSLKGMEADDLIEIHKIFSRRYLIVMDDMWSVEAWDNVRRLFPENYNGSKIILTTRLLDVATYVAPLSHVHMMRFMDDKQSWRLFQHKVFGDQDCPHELQSVGEKIVKGCGGLPLSIVTVAELLSRIPRTPKLWKQIEGNDGQLGSILSLSYNHLPPHLRKCFLYMAGFPQDYDIHASELIKLWVAEGFLERHSESERVELVAEECLEDLIKQSLVLVTSRKIDGKIKSCRLHSMVRDFCVRKAGKEKFLLPVMDFFPNPILRRHFLPHVLQNHRRISVSWYDLHLKDSTHTSCTTSIICIQQRGYRPKGSIENFTSLKVLHILRRNDHSYWELGQVFELIYLTYLAFSIPDSIVPPAIAKLQNLQTLIIYRFDVHLPVEIWRLRQLRHLIAFSFHSLPIPKVASPLRNLQTLSIATNFVCGERIVKIIPSIRKLGICYSEEEFGADYHLDNLIHFLRLEKLKLKTHSSSAPHPYSLIFPLSLIKLELSGGWICWTDMAIVGSLPDLQVLKLKNYACHGEHWETVGGEFRKLMLLLIDESDLNHWKTRSSHFPRLKCLMLHRCPYLDEIPHDIGNITTLELIEIDDRNRSLSYSTNIIREMHRKVTGDDSLKVVKRS